MLQLAIIVDANTLFVVGSLSGPVQSGVRCRGDECGRFRSEKTFRWVVRLSELLNNVDSQFHSKNSKRAHLRARRFKTPPKFHEKSLQRGMKE